MTLPLHAPEYGTARNLCDLWPHVSVLPLALASIGVILSLMSASLLLSASMSGLLPWKKADLLVEETVLLALVLVAAMVLNPIAEVMDDLEIHIAFTPGIFNQSINQYV